MILRTKIAFTVTILLLIILSSCIKVETFPPEPVIKFKEFKVYPNSDSAAVVLSFQDGDGDIGLDIEDTLSPYNSDSYFYYNAYLEYYELMNGVWVKGTADPNGNNFPTADTIVFKNRLPNITPIGQNKALKGDVILTLEPFYYNPVSNHSDSIKYKVVIIDRALNISNIIETGVITH